MTLHQGFFEAALSASSLEVALVPKAISKTLRTNSVAALSLHVLRCSCNAAHAVPSPAAPRTRLSRFHAGVSEQGLSCL